MSLKYPKMYKGVHNGGSISKICWIKWLLWRSTKWISATSQILWSLLLCSMTVWVVVLPNRPRMSKYVENGGSMPNIWLLHYLPHNKVGGNRDPTKYIRITSQTNLFIVLHSLWSGYVKTVTMCQKLSRMFWRERFQPIWIRVFTLSFHYHVIGKIYASRVLI